VKAGVSGGLAASIVYYWISLAMLTPTGFWSYTSSDNTSSQGKISKLRTALSDELQQQIGRDPKVSIFEDSAEIAPGREWENRIRLAIENSSFLIPIITPGFLQSEWCCQEVNLFRHREKQLGRSDLIFPIHYVDTDYVTGENPAYCKDAEVLRFLRTRQWVNFRPLRKKSLESEDVELKLEEIARAIATALRMVVGPRKDVPSTPKRTEAAPVAKPRQNMLFSSAPPYGTSWSDLHSKAGDRYPLDGTPKDQPPVTVLRSGMVDGMAYSLYSDGSIEAQMPEGMMRFASIDELRSHLDQRP
jgi:hypothetical protein